MKHDSGITIHFTDGTSLGFEFPKQADNKYARQIMTREILSERLLMVESDGALYFVPFDNIRYISAFPAAGDVPKNTIRGATLRE
ncbi:MAG TPA: hypothetical protein VJT81_10425 [Burkholderiales bacterium]|nr:hypothetical protein [Burkholderiales bacterium]